MPISSFRLPLPFVRLLLGSLLLPLFGTLPAAGQPAAITGTVTDSTDGSPLAHATVRLSDSTGTTTDSTGAFELTDVPPGPTTLTVSYVGYHPKQRSVTLASGDVRRVNVALAPTDVQAGQLTVRADAPPRSINTRRLDAAALDRLPSAFETDLFRSLSLRPGITRTSDYSSRLYIRGGGHGHTLVRLDGTTIYNPTHFLGFYSLFHPEAIGQVDLHKGPYPASYGGRLGSVIDVQTKSGTTRSRSGTFTLGLTASGGHIEGPLGSDASPWGSYMVAARRSTSELLLLGLQQTGKPWIPDDTSFTDLNARLDATLSPRDHLSVALYGSRDDMKLLDNNLRLETEHLNLGTSATWSRRIGAAWSSTLSLNGSLYRNEPVLDNGDRHFEETNALREVALDAGVEHTPTAPHTVAAGLRATALQFVLENEERTSNRRTTGWDHDRTGVSVAAYVQDTYRPTSGWRLRGGLRGTYYRNGNAWRLAPRLSVRYDATRSVRLHASYGRTYQFRSVDADPRFSGFDTWLIADEGVSPAANDQFAAGTTVDLTERWRLQAAGYHRRMHDLFELKPSLPFPPRGDYADRFRIGEGRAYGAELSVRRRTGIVTGQLNYTIGRTERTFPSRAPRRFESVYYPAHHDRTHQLAISTRWHLTDEWTLTSRFQYKTGRPYTPNEEDPLFDDPFPNEPELPPPPAFVNNERLPAYHRLDVGAKKTGPLVGTARYTLTMTVSNVYGRRNVWFYRFENSRQGRTRIDVPQIPVPVPYVTFSVDF